MVMHLYDRNFKSIKEGTKTIEKRLNDDKRRNLKKGDIVKLVNIADDEALDVEVVDLHKYDSFEELYKHFDKVSMGYKEDENADPKDMEKYYSKEEQQLYGVVGIEIKRI